MNPSPERRRPHGAREWLTERAALVALLPLALWLAISGWSLAGAGYEEVLAWASSGLNATLLAVMAVVFCFYASLAWKVIIEDYVHDASAKSLAMAANFVVFAILALAALYFIVLIALGSAPAGA